MIVSVLQLPVRAGCEGDVVRFYADHDIFVLAAQGGGFRAGRLLEPTQAGQPWLVIAEWDEAADYDRWLAAPTRAGLSEALGQLLAGDPTSSTYHTHEESNR